MHAAGTIAVEVALFSRSNVATGCDPSTGHLSGPSSGDHMVEQRLADLDIVALRNGRTYHPSPIAWEDQVLYFLLVDRFSDGQEHGYRDNAGQIVTAGSTAPFTPSDRDNAIDTESDAAVWRESGNRWVGGSLKGLQSKLGYLKRLGVTAIWVSPIFKQVAFNETYHGYGIQNFLDVDPHIGTREDLRDLVTAAHELGMYVILDVILNHTGDVFDYNADRYVTPDGHGGTFVDPRWDGNPYAVRGYRDSTGAPSLPFGPVDLAAHPTAWPDGAIWPAELQPRATFSQLGHISNMDNDPEFRQGDFFSLKDVAQGSGSLDDYQPSAALEAACQAYKFWIAYADVDGFRVDAVKHMDLGATRFFASVMHEVTQDLGKENFYLIGEITGGRDRAYTTLEDTGLDAALGLDDTAARLESFVKGRGNPADYFDLFRNSLLIDKGSHTWFRNKLVTMLDDHDLVRQGDHKHRFCALDPDFQKLALSAMATNATTLGIPCLYYGSEQLFDGEGGSDRYIREAMFGGAFGPFRSRNRHLFDEDGAVFKALAAIHAVRRQESCLRRGRQYLREISGDGQHFGVPQMVGGQLRSIVAWSRILDTREVLVVTNTDPASSKTAWVTVDHGLHPPTSQLTCRYSTDSGQIGATLSVQPQNGSAVEVTLPPGGFAIWS